MEGQKLFDGVIQEAGGGMVEIWVERDTIRYPVAGQKVRVYARERAEALEDLERRVNYFYPGWVNVPTR